MEQKAGLMQEDIIESETNEDLTDDGGDSTLRRRKGKIISCAKETIENDFVKKKRNALRDKNFAMVAEMCNKIASHYHNSGDYEDAYQEFEEERDAWRKIGSKMDAARAERMMGEMQMLLGEFEKALALEHQYLKVAKEEKNAVEEQRAYATIGRIYLIMGQSEESRKSLALAEKMFLKSLLVCKSLTLGRFESAEMEGRIMLNLGVVKENSSDFEESQTYYEKAIHIAKKNDLFELLYQCYLTLGLFHGTRSKDTAKAIQNHNLASSVAERLPDRLTKVSEALLSKAEILLKAGDAQSAKPPLVQAYKMKSSATQERVEELLKAVVALERVQERLLQLDTEEFGEMKALNEKMGDVWCKLGNFAKAAEFYEKMLECAKSNAESGRQLIPVYVSLYQTYRDDERYSLALDFMWLEYELVKEQPREAMETLLCIADVQEEAKYSYFDTSKIFQRAFEAFPCEKALRRWFLVAKKHGMSLDQDKIRDLAAREGFNLVSDSQESEEMPAEEANVSIGDDVDLAELFPEEETQRTRKRTTTLAVKKNIRGETQLHQACIAGNLTLVRKLLDQGHSVLERDYAGWLPIHEAANHGFKEIVDELIRSGGPEQVNDKGGLECDGITPLYDACCNGNLEVVELLLERGANPTILTNGGDSALTALDLWHQEAQSGLNEAEETMFQGLRAKIRDCLTRTGNLGSSSKAGISSRASTSSRSTGSSSSSRRRESGYLSLSRLRMGIDSESDEEPAHEKPKRKPEEPKKGAAEYRDVMQRLRKPNSSKEFEKPSSIKRPALVDASNLADEWLEDDLAPSKKRKVEPHEFSRGHTIKSPIRSSTQRPHRSRVDVSPIEISPVRRSPRGTPKNSPVVLEKSPRVSQKTQSVIRDLDEVFTVPKDPPAALDFDDDFMDDNVPVWQTSLKKTPSFQSPEKQPRRSTFCSIAVRIEDELISVPVKNDEIDRLTIGWLAKEAAGRFANLFGRTPDMQLTLDGAVMISSDPLALALNTSEVCARVLSWKTISVSERYDAACLELKRRPIEEVSRALEDVHPNKHFQLAELNLSAADFEPVCTALKMATPLGLNLASNCLLDDGIYFLTGIAEGSLKELRFLDLTGNFLTSSSVRFLREKLPRLESLTLNHNIVGDSALPSLGFPSLRSLHLRSCGIHNLEDLPLEGVTDLDLSFNQLSPSVLNLRRKVCEIEKLDLSFVGRLAWDELFTGSLRSLKELRVSGNRLTDSDVAALLTACPNLRFLDLSYNGDLTCSTVQNLSRVKRLHLEGCPRLLDEFDKWEDVGEAPEYLQMSVGAEGEQRESQLQCLSRTWARVWGEGRTKVQVGQLQVTATVLLLDDKHDNVQSLAGGASSV